MGGTRSSGAVRSGGAAVLAGLLALLLVGCTEAVESDGPPRPAQNPSLRGSVLALDDRFQGGLVAFDALTDARAEMRLPAHVGEILGGRWDADGDGAFLVVRHQNGERRVYRAWPDREPEPVGPPQPLRDGFGGADVRGGVVLSTVCDARREEVLTLDLAAPGAWRRTAPACLAALSPDGREVAYAESGTVWRVAADGTGVRERVVTVAELDGSSFGDVRRAGIVSGLQWGQGGIGFVIGLDDRQAAVTVAPGGEPTLTVLGDAGATFGADMAWQPDGDLVAVASRSHAEGIVRLLDRRTQELRVIGLDTGFFWAPRWSPDGEVVVAMSANGWLYVSAEGEWLKKSTTGRAVPLDWKF